MLLIYPPSTLVSEAPAGLARLKGFAQASGSSVKILDLNVEGFHFLVQKSLANPVLPEDRFGRRALKRAERNILRLQDSATYRSRAEYTDAVVGLQKVLAMAGTREGKGRKIIPGLANYSEEGFDPLNSLDLIKAAETPEKNIYFPLFSRRIDEILQENSCSRIGLSINFLNQAITAFAVAGYIKKRYPQISLAAGGGLVTSWSALSDWKYPFSGLFDYWVPGNGESFLPDWMNISDIRGKNMIPDYSDNRQLSYLSPGFILPYAASLGCPWRRCSFCPETTEQNPYLPVSLSRMEQELKILVKLNNPCVIHFLDNELSTSQLKVLAESPPGAPWYGFSRFHELLGDPDFCFSLASSGCRMLKLGLESGDPDVLESMEKGINLDLAGIILENLKKAGIKTFIYLLFGTPEENEEKAMRTMEYIKKHADHIDFLNLAVFNLPRDSRLAASLARDVFYEADLSLYSSFEHPSGWHRGKVKNFLNRIFTCDPQIKEIIKKSPPVFGSSHAVFM